MNYEELKLVMDKFKEEHGDSKPPKLYVVELLVSEYTDRYYHDPNHNIWLMSKSVWDKFVEMLPVIEHNTEQWGMPIIFVKSIFHIPEYKKEITTFHSKYL